MATRKPEPTQNYFYNLTNTKDSLGEGAFSRALFYEIYEENAKGDVKLVSVDRFPDQIDNTDAKKRFVNRLLSNYQGKRNQIAKRRRQAYRQTDRYKKAQVKREERERKKVKAYKEKALKQQARELKKQLGLKTSYHYPKNKDYSFKVGHQVFYGPAYEGGEAIVQRVISVNYKDELVIDPKDKEMWILWKAEMKKDFDALIKKVRAKHDSNGGTGMFQVKMVTPWYDEVGNEKLDVRQGDKGDSRRGFGVERTPINATDNDLSANFDRMMVNFENKADKYLVSGFASDITISQLVIKEIIQIGL